MGYKKDTVRGIFWIGSYRVSVRAMSLVRTAILARILSPADFGIVTVAALSLTFLEIFTETGINTVLIQTKDKVRNFINTAWVVSIFRGLIISGTLLLMAPIISSFFDSPKSLEVVRLISLVPLLRGFINPSVVLFQKDLRFKGEFLLRTIIFFIDASIAVMVAYFTRSPLSIVYGLIAGALSEVFLTQIFISPRPKFEYDKKKMGYVISRGKWMTLTGIFDYLFQNADTIIVGRLLGLSSLGLYQNAYQLSTLPVSEVSNILSKVTFPIFMKISDEKKRLYSAFHKTLLATIITTLPLAIVFFIMPELIINLVLGSQWIGAAPALRILGFLGVVRSTVLTSYAIFLAQQKQRYVFIVSASAAISMIVLLPVLITSQGLVGAAYAALLGGITAGFVAYYCLNKV